jgi:hypothetical protein
MFGNDVVYKPVRNRAGCLRFKIKGFKCHIRYVPVLRTKAAEIPALANLSASAKARIFPVIRITGAISTTVQSNLVSKLQSFPFSLDGGYNFDVTGSAQTFMSLFSALGNGGLSIIPAVSTNDDPAYIAAALSLIGKFGNGVVAGPGAPWGLLRSIWRDAASCHEEPRPRRKNLPYGLRAASAFCPFRPRSRRAPRVSCPEWKSALRGRIACLSALSASPKMRERRVEGRVSAVKLGKGCGMQRLETQGERAQLCRRLFAPGLVIERGAADIFRR